MKTYTVQVELQSPTLIGSGEGFGATIDTDVVFDEVGLPLIPAKRIKGCLRDAAQDIEGMLSLAAGCTSSLKIALTFGTPGEPHPAPVYFSNLTLEQYEQNVQWLTYFLKDKKYADIFPREAILATFTEIRQQTAIDDETGVADDHSLRTIRILKQDLTFSGQVKIDATGNLQTILPTLVVACANLRNLGTKRNRGLGEVRCHLLEDGQVLSAENYWKEIVTCTP